MPVAGTNRAERLLEQHPNVVFQRRSGQPWQPKGCSSATSANECSGCPLDFGMALFANCHHRRALH
jgi:hypothetical protein